MDKDKDKKNSLDLERIEKIKRALCYLKIARHPDSDNIAYTAMIAGETFNENVIKPLEEACGWTEKDEKKIMNGGKEFHEETKEGHTLKERVHLLGKYIKEKKWWFLAGGAVVVAATKIVNHFSRKKENNNHNNEIKNTPI